MKNEEHKAKYNMQISVSIKSGDNGYLDFVFFHLIIVTQLVFECVGLCFSGFKFSNSESPEILYF